MTKKLAITFEAGGDPTVCTRMLDVLSLTQTQTTIFLAGSWSEQYPDLVRRMFNDGHELGNHSYSHPDLTQSDDEQIRVELRRVNEVITRLTGQILSPWFRPPYDAIDKRVRQIVVDEGYRLVQRNALDGGHWPGETTPDSVKRRSLENAYNGAVLTYHLDNLNTLEALSQIVNDLRAAGFELVRLSELRSVSERPERRRDFAALKIAPGYLQVLKRQSRAWSLNAVEYGARANAPTDTPIPIANTHCGAIHLLISNGVSGWQPASERDRYLLVLAGKPTFSFRTHDDPSVRIRAVSAPGDLILWSKDYELSAARTKHHWIVLTFE